MKEVPKGGDVLHGKFVPGGTRIAHSTWSILRNTSVFGDDADLFRPERWLKAEPTKRAQMEKTTELVFGHGRWGCAGKSVAFLELNKIFVEVSDAPVRSSIRTVNMAASDESTQLLRDFDFQIIYPSKPWSSFNFNLFMQNEMWVRVTER